MSNEIAFLPDKILETVSSMSDFVLQYSLALAATSVLAMALLEAWKKIFNTRERFHMRQIFKWISQAELPPAISESKDQKPERFHDQVYRQLILLTTGQNLDERHTLSTIQKGEFTLMPFNVLFALELERMMGQIQEAVEIVLSNPTVYNELYLFLTQGASSKDISTWEYESQNVPDEEDCPRSLIKERIDAFNRLNKVVKRKLDSLQITIKFKWSRRNQKWSIILGGALLFVSLGYIELNESAWALVNPLTWLRVLIASLVGGIVAPVSKDLVAALRKVRQSG